MIFTSFNFIKRRTSNVYKTSFNKFSLISIKKSLNQNKFPNNTKEIIVSSNTSLYSFPEISTKELLVLNIGTHLTVLRNWKVSESEIWVRVELASNKFLDDPNKITKGWIKM